jgi:hypothetical protein
MSAASSAAVRVPLVERDQVPPEVADLYDRLYEPRNRSSRECPASIEHAEWPNQEVSRGYAR